MFLLIFKNRAVVFSTLKTTEHQIILDYIDFYKDRFQDKLKGLSPVEYQEKTAD
ncbi:IS3 family transposase [Lentibacillus halodurans]|uniref:IS3 family transposase n=1 Tax=Lentibacillus halodurans TaxID=237679 RepID=UPI000B7D601C